MRLLVAFLIALALPGTAKGYYGFKLGGYHASPHMRTWVHESRMPLPPDRISVGFGDPAMYGPHSIFLPSCCTGGWTHQAIQGLLFHELGHVYDATRMTPALREEFRQLVGVPQGWAWKRPIPVENAQALLGGGYVLVPGKYENIAPSEMFAEEYAACSLGLSQWDYQASYNSYGWLPPPGTDASLCALIASA